MAAIIEVQTRREGEIVDLTAQIARAVEGTRNGIATVFVVGSTAAITTIEFEPGLQKDFPDALEKIAPRDGFYAHEATWHDDNGHSHVRASLIGPSLTIPIVEGALTLGTWQQVVLVELDTRPRDRRVVVQIVGA